MIYDEANLNKIKKDKALSIFITIFIAAVYISITLPLYFISNRDNEMLMIILIAIENAIILSLFCVSLFAYTIPLIRKEIFIKRLLGYKTVSYSGVIDKISDTSYYINGTSFKLISISEDNKLKDFYIETEYVNLLKIGREYLIHSNNGYLIGVQDEVL